MKINDFVLTTDLLQLSRSEYASLVKYLEFFGIRLALTYESLHSAIRSRHRRLVVLKHDTGCKGLWFVKDSFVCSGKHVALSEIRRMSSLGEALV